MGRNDLQAFVSRYVLEASQNELRRNEILKVLASGLPHCRTVKASVALIDISGFTSLTAELAKRGKISSELITQAVSEYLSDIINVVSDYRGDVIKFLGDALLICFDETKEGEIVDNLKADDDAYRASAYKSIACAAEVMIKCGTKAIELPNVSPTAGEPTLSLQAEGSTSIAHLKLHITVGAGSITHVIIGSPIKAQRCDYCISGDILHEIGYLLGETLPGEMGLTAELRNITTFRNPPDWAFDKNESRIFRSGDGDSESLIFTQLAMETVRSMALKNIPKCYTESNDDLEDKFQPVQYRNAELSEPASFCRMFINQSLVWKMEQEDFVSEAPKGYRKMSALRRSFSTTRSYSGGFESCSPEHIIINPPKYSTKSLISEFRFLSIMFIKLNFPYEPEMAQIIYQDVVEILMECGGFIQQFSVDDKGQTLLSIFGLPPKTHENNAIFAVKAAVSVARAFQTKKITPATLAITTNEILYSTLGNSKRSEAGFLGDVVNMAARIMCINVDEETIGTDPILVLCDDATRNAASTTFPSNELGEFKFKGMTEEVKVWRIDAQLDRQARLQDPKQDSEVFSIGYKEEREKLQSCLDNWYSFGERAVIIVEAPSGMGKSSLCNYALQLARNKNDLWICRSEGSEIDQSTPYFAFQAIIPRLLDLSETIFLETASVISAGSHMSHATSNIDCQISVATDTGSFVSLGRSNTRLSVRKRRKSAGSQSKDSNPFHPTSWTPVRGLCSKDEAIPDPLIHAEVEEENSSAFHIEQLRKEILKDVASSITSKDNSLEVPTRYCISLQKKGPTVKPSRRRFSSALSKSVMSYQSSSVSLHPMDSVKRIHRILSFMNEPTDLAPLLSQIMPWLNLRDNARTATLNAQAKKELLKSLIIKFLVKASEKSKVLFILDDLQWFDSVSLELVQMIVKTVPNVMCILVTRPIEEYNLVSVGKLCKQPFIIHLRLKGFTIEETQEYLVWQFRDKNVNAIEQTLLSEFYKRCGGCPLFVEQATETLKSAFEERLHVSPIGILETNYDLVDYEVLLIRSVDSAITNTFDQLSPAFQSLLRVAAVFGQYFELDIVMQVMELDVDAAELRSLIERTSDKARKIKYLDDSSSLYMGQYLLQEAALSLKTVITVAESEPEIKGDALRMSKWWSLLAFAQVYLRQYKAGRESGLAALRLIGIAWPQNEAEYKVQTAINAKRLAYLWTMTCGGRFVIADYSQKGFRRKTDIVLRVMPIFREILAYDPTIPQCEQPLVANMYLNASVAVAARDGVDEFVKAC
ncbi:hypothetical protein HDU67_006817, partial [Dinochytrium kinnereticum]